MNKNKTHDHEYTKIIRPCHSLFDLRFKGVREYKDFYYLIFFEAILLICAVLIIYIIKSINSLYSHFVIINPLIGVVKPFTFVIILISIGIIIFNKVEQSNMDSV